MARILLSFFYIAFTLCISTEIFARESAGCQAIRDKRDNLQNVCTKAEAKRAGSCEPFKVEIIKLDDQLRKNCTIVTTYDFKSSASEQKKPKICEIEYNTWNTRTSSTYSPNLESESENNAYLSVLRNDPKAKEEAIIATQFVALREMLEENIVNVPVEQRNSESFQEFQASIDSAILSYDVYSDQSIPGVLPEGISRVGESDLKELGLLQSDLVDEESGYYAAVYKDVREGGAPKYVYVNRGTEGWPISTDEEDKDGWANSTQGTGYYSLQHAQAVNNAKIIKSKIDMMNSDIQPPERGTSLTFAGHSLGGGLASLQALATSLPANVINPAGLHQNSLERVNTDLSKANELIHASIVEGEVLDTANGLRVNDITSVLPWWVSATTKINGVDNALLTPQSYGKKNYLPAFQSGTFGGRSFKDSWSGWNHAIDLHGVQIALKGMIINWCKENFGI